MSSKILASIGPLKYRRSLPQTCHQNASRRREVGSLTFLAVLVYTTGRGQPKPFGDTTKADLPFQSFSMSSNGTAARPPSSAYMPSEFFTMPPGKGTGGPGIGSLAMMAGTGRATTKRYRSDNDVSSRWMDGEASDARSTMASNGPPDRSVIHDCV